MDAVKFLKEKKRMCDSFGDYCTECEIYKIQRIMHCDTSIEKYPEQTVEIVERWSKEHPQATRLSQFLKYYPNAPLDDDGTPKVCVNELGFTRDDGCTALNCINCWNRPIEEE